VLLGLLTALSIACIALTDPAPLAVLYVLLGAGAMLGCRLGPVRMLRAQLPFLAFAGGIFTVNVLSRPGHEPWPELPVRITEEGIVLGAALALRALVIGLGAVVVARAADPRRTVVSLQQHARLPARYAYALLAGRRVLDDLPQQWETITRAHRVRLPLTSQGQVARLRARDRVRCAFSLLVDAVRRADRIAFALESRGLGERPRTLWRPVPLGAADALLALGVAVVVVAVLVLGGAPRPSGASRSELLAGEALVGLDVPLAGLGDHLGRQLRRRRGGALGPAGGGGGQPVAHELLVQARRGAAGNVGVRGPEPARVR